jgi:N-acetylmuramoyl-L-alanine amidase
MHLGPGRLLRVTRLCAIACIATVLGACAPARVGSPLADAWSVSPNAGERRPDFIILHHTGSRSAESARLTLTSAQAGVSAHYLVDRDGRITQLVDERLRAWHAGDSRWGSDSDLNSSSIGIELVNDGDEPFPQAQIDRLIHLLRDLRERYRLPARNILGHADIAPRRKVDPSRHFPWDRLGREGFGLWCEPPVANGSVLPGNSPTDPPSVPVPALAVDDPLLMLKAIGYDMRDARAALLAWRRHHRPAVPALTMAAGASLASIREAIDPDDRALLRCLLERSAGDTLTGR